MMELKGNKGKSQAIRGILLEAISDKEHPTKVLRQAIEFTYGHKVKLNELVKLIEGSEVLTE